MYIAATVARVCALLSKIDFNNHFISFFRFNVLCDFYSPVTNAELCCKVQECPDAAHKSNSGSMTIRAGDGSNTAC